MDVLGVLSGTGTLAIKGLEIEVDYTLTVRQGRGIRSGDGRLTGDTYDLMRTFDASEGELALEDGRKVTVVIDNLRGNEATFKVSGIIPGF